LPDLNELLSRKNVIVVHPFHESEIASPKFGGARLIQEQVEYLRERGNNVSVVSLSDIGSITSFFYRLPGRFRRRKGTIVRSSEVRRWTLNSFARIVEDTLSGIDFLFARRVRDKIKALGEQSLIIFHYPYAYRPFYSAIADLRYTGTIYEHNIEWQFLESNIGQGRFARFMISRSKKIELASLRKAEFVILVSEKDRRVLESEGISNDKMIVWIPIRRKPAPAGRKSESHEFDELAAQYFLVGFVGSNFAPNVQAVTNIIRIAESLSDSKIMFVIFGNVADAFSGRTIPNNVHFAGYVDDLDQYLSSCKAFINPKTTSETGVEIKMFDYLKFERPIVTTKVGSHGFENFDKVIIAELEAFPDLLRELVMKEG
jgi:glycosyltransferase involved in cell wall biosynthesis